MRPGPAITVLLCAALAACAGSPSGTADSQRRMDELAAIAREGGESRIPAVLPSLRSDDPLVRHRAQQTLLTLAGTTNGYDWAAPREVRERAVDAWVEWCRRRGLAQPAEGTPHA